MFTVVENVEGAATGRIATFTLGDARPVLIREALTRLGYGGGPNDPTPENALRESAEQFVFRWNMKFGATGKVRAFARKVTRSLVELLTEHVRDDGQGADRYVVGRAGPDGLLDCSDSAVGNVWLETFAYYSEHLTSSVLGSWAEPFVLDKFQAMELANRGHSVHVRPAYANAFDAWLDAMRKVCDVQAVTFATVDSDPQSLASLVQSMRQKVERTIELETMKACNVKTERGRDAILNRLRECRKLLEGYRDLATGEVEALGASIAEAECAVALAVIA